MPATGYIPGMRMVIHDTNGLSAELKTLLESGAWVAGAQAVKRNIRRSIYRLPAAAGQPGLYIKHDHPVNPRDLLKNLWRCKARQEYESGMSLAAAGVPVVAMLAWGRCGRDSFLVTREASGARMLSGYLLELERAPLTRPVFAARLVAFLRRMLVAGVHHPDLHAGNVLVVGLVSQPELLLVDVYGVTTGERTTVGDRQLLAFALSILGRLNLAARNQFFKRLLPDASLASIDTVCGEAHELLRKAFRRRWRGRRRGFLRAGGNFEMRNTRAGRWLIHRSLDSVTTDRWLAAFASAPPAPGVQWLKQDKTRRLARVSADGGATVVIKEFRRPGPWGNWRPDCRCWLNTQMCDALGIPVMGALAWLRCRDGRGLVFFQDAGDVSLRAAFQAPIAPLRRRLLLTQVAWIFGRLHAYGILHGDCKATSFMVVPAAQLSSRQSPWVRGGLEAVAMIDADSLSQRSVLALPQGAENLADWRGSMPDGFSMTRQEVGRFLCVYSRLAGWTRLERRALAARFCA